MSYTQLVDIENLVNFYFKKKNVIILNFLFFQPTGGWNFEQITKKQKAEKRVKQS